MKTAALRLAPAALLALLTGCPHKPDLPPVPEGRVRITIQLNGCPLPFTLRDAKAVTVPQANPTGGPTAEFEVEPGNGYQLLNAQTVNIEAISFDVPADGPILVKEPKEAAKADGRTLHLITKAVQLDPGPYGESGNWITVGKYPGLLANTPQVFQLVAGMSYQCENGLMKTNSMFTFKVDADGTPTAINPPGAAIGQKPPANAPTGQPKVDGILRLNCLMVEVKPPNDKVRYYVGRPESRSYTGSQSVVVPNELRARIGVVGAADDFEDFLVHTSDTQEHTITTSSSHTVFGWQVIGPTPK
jgi:hypothetical protein